MNLRQNSSWNTWKISWTVHMKWDRIPVEIPGKNHGLCIWNETEFQLKYLEKILDCAYEMRQSKLFQLHRTHLPHLNHRSTTLANVNATYTASSSKRLPASFHVHLYILCTQGWRATAGLDICPLPTAAFREGRVHKGANLLWLRCHVAASSEVGKCRRLSVSSSSSGGDGRCLCM